MTPGGQASRSSAAEGAGASSSRIEQPGVMPSLRARFDASDILCPLSSFRGLRRFGLAPAVCEVFQQATLGGVVDEGREPPLAGRVGLRARHPPDGGALIRGYLRLEERPGWRVGTKRRLIRCVER